MVDNYNYMIDNNRIAMIANINQIANSVAVISNLIRDFLSL